jgi:protein-tyrosine phosphatase
MKYYLAERFHKTAFFFSFFYGTLLPEIGGAWHWHWITDHIILGALPIKSKWLRFGKHHLKIIQQSKDRKKPLALVISAVQRFELQGLGLPMHTVQPDDWKEQHVVPYQVSIADFSAEVKPVNIWVAVQKIDHAVKSNQSVYIHCKAGRGRSWMISMCYLTTFGGMDFHAAAKLVRQKRHRVSPLHEQIDFVKRFAAQYRSQAELANTVAST